MHVIGTAGHVDHGKSTLVEALTGINPDRLKEEKERAMTIDLGFAWMKTGPGRDEVGIIDVPGHRDFIENMLAGVGGIDLALLVIAADEGVMPQTREHLAILDLLQVSGGIVALTKVDLVDDPDWLELVSLDVMETLSGTVLTDAPVIQVSPVTGLGMDELRRTLLERLDLTAPRPDLGRPRLPIDRVFSLSGFGTIVTGTLLDGQFQVGDPVVVLPAGLKGRIRGLQTHRTKLEIAQPGSRVAVNLTGVPKDLIQRGDVLAAPGLVDSTVLCDVAYRHLPDAPIPLKHNVEVKLHVGSTEVLARTRVLGQRQIAPGDQGWLQLALRKAIVVSRGDRFILRRPSPAETIGGGSVVDPHPGRRHRRFKSEVTAKLATLAEGTPEELLLQTAARHEPIQRAELLARSGLSQESADVAWRKLLDEDSVREVNGYVFTSSGWRQLKERLIHELSRFHKGSPLRVGIGREELRSRIRVVPAVFSDLVAESISEHLVTEQRGLVFLPDHVVTFSDRQQQAIGHLLANLEREGVNSTSVKDSRVQIGDDVYAALIELDQLVQISEDVVYSRPVYESIVSQIRRFLQQEGSISAAQLRDLLKTSRKYAIAILEHLDDIHVTRRDGDIRRLAS